MQVLNAQPNASPPYRPVGGSYNNINTAQQGSDGLSGLSGLNRNMEPMARALQSQGRGDDSVLVHMTPNEVNSLRGLAQHFGGDLSVNPNTGLPEAGWLGKLLPTLLGVGLNFLLPGVGSAIGSALGGIGSAAGTGLLVGAGTTAVTGDLQKGLMAGLGAFGGASMAGALGAGASGAAGAGSNLAGNVATEAMGNVAAINAAAPGMASAAANSTLAGAGAGGLGGNAASSIADIASNAAAGATPPPSGLFSRFGAAAREGMKPGTFPYKAAPMAAGLGLVNTVSEATRPNLKKYEEEDDNWNYEGPYKPQPRELRPRVYGQGEIDYFAPSNPYPGYTTRTGAMPTGFADGGSTRQSAASETRMLTPEEAWAMQDRTNAIPLEARQHMIDYAGDVAAYDLMSSGDRKGNQFSGVVTADHAPGAVANFNGKQLTLGDDMRWRVTGNTPPPNEVATPTSPTTTSPTAPPGLPTLDTATGTSPTTTMPPPTTTPTVRPPMTNMGPTPSGYGLETLADPYVPRFQERPDYRAQAGNPYTMGGRLASNLGQYAALFGGSPGAITASRTYEGGSPSQRIRALAQENATAGERDYGFAKAAANPDGSLTAPVQNTGYQGYRGYLDYVYRSGGQVQMDDGSFVVDARTVSEIGNGSSNAGIEILRRLGGQAVSGPGDGVSDSVPARIGKSQEARVARDEVVFSADAVKRLGGADKLYALMNKAHKARKQAKRGQDTKVAKSLGAV